MSTLQDYDLLLVKQSHHGDDSLREANSFSSESSYSDIVLISASPDPPSYPYMISPREEEGNEKLPEYSCTVYKRGYVYMKPELDSPTVKSKNRIWKKVYLELWGTSLQIHKYDRFRWPRKPQRSSESPCTLSLAGADAARALDYFKRPYTLRLITDGPQFLIRVSSHEDMISWIEHLQASINISLDLESRPMPRFVTISPRELTNNSTLDFRIIERERALEQRRRNQHEILI